MLLAYSWRILFTIHWQLQRPTVPTLAAAALGGRVCSSLLADSWHHLALFTLFNVPSFRSGSPHRCACVVAASNSVPNVPFTEICASHLPRSLSRDAAVDAAMPFIDCRQLGGLEVGVGVEMRQDTFWRLSEGKPV
jgi:hypothetical protein